MWLYLVQHGEAKPKSEDPERSLTERGHDDVERVAAFVKGAGVEVFQIRHSDRRRTQQTATLLAEHLAPAGGLVTLANLAPKDEVHPLAELLNRETRPLMFVGHRPFLDRLVGLLVTSDPQQTVVRFRKGGIVCLQRKAQDRAWHVEWAITPELIQ
jgi:phosphohistidine phosphatase